MWKLLKRSLSMGRLTETKRQAHETKLAQQINGTVAAREAYEANKTQAQAQLNALKKSYHIRHLDCGSCNGCDWEMSALLNSIYDLQQYGFDFVASPRHADLLMCTGPMTTQLLQAALLTHDATPHPKQVIAVGDCAINGGVFKEAYSANGGVGRALPVQLKIPGCPPSPEDILQALLTLKA